MKRLAIITTHPIQYYAPVFQLMHSRNIISIKVFYTWGEESVDKFDPGFDKNITWDIPLLDNYPFEWAKNTASDPGSHHFKGIINLGLVKQVEQYKPDAILVFGWAYQSHLKIIRYFKNKIPVYFRGDSTLLNERKGVKSLLKTIILNWVYSHVDHAFYIGANNKAYFKKYGLKDNQLIFAPHAIDNERFGADRKAETLELRQRLGINSDHLLVLFAGKLEEKKSPMLLLDAFLLLNKPGTHLLFVGNGNLEKLLREKAGGHKNIHFIDFQNQSFMPVVYQACDLFCLPSKGPEESWGLVVNEAMACKKAILVSDKCGCAVDLIGNENGIIFKSEDVTELSSCLATMLSTPSGLIDYGIKSGVIIKNWNFAHIADAIEKKLCEEGSN